MTEWEIANLPSSETGKRMLKRVSPIYDNSIFMKMFYEGVGSEFDKVRAYFETLREQSFAPTVDWAIEYQERKYSITPDKNLTLEQRRERLKIKLQSKRPLNPAILEQYIKENYGVEVYLNEKKRAGYITLELENYTGTEKFIKWLLREKPAHLCLLIILAKSFVVPFYAGIARFYRGRIQIPTADFYTTAVRQITAETDDRKFIITPDEVAILRDDATVIIPVSDSSRAVDELALKVTFPSSQRIITLPNPRADLTIEEVQEVADYATENQILLNTAKEQSIDVPQARIITTVEDILF